MSRIDVHRQTLEDYGYAGEPTPEGLLEFAARELRRVSDRNYHYQFSLGSDPGIEAKQDEEALGYVVSDLLALGVVLS